MIANERGGQGRYCSRVQSGAAVVDRGLGRLVARTLVSAPVKAPALPAVLLRRSVCLCMAAAALRPNVCGPRPVSTTGVPRLCLYCCRPPCGPRSGARSCMPNSTTRLVPRVCERKALTARHTQCSTQLAHRPASMRASLGREEGRGQGGSLTVQSTREWASLAWNGVA